MAVSAEDDGDDIMVDYHELKAGLRYVLKELDHKNLDGIVNPSTVENLCRWLWGRLVMNYPALSWIEVREQADTVCRLSRC